MADSDFHSKSDLITSLNLPPNAFFVTDDEGVIRSFDNGMLQARLYTALQTALTRIEDLEASNAALAARLDAAGA